MPGLCPKHLFRVLPALAGCSVPVKAEAHLGLAANDLYAGMLHPLLHLSSLLPMIALALWLSCCELGALKRLVPLYLVAAIAGALMAWLGPALFDAGAALVVLAAVTGIGAAVARGLPLWVSAPLVAMLGLMLGFDNVAKVQAELGSPLLFVAGLTLSLGLVLLHVTATLYGREQLWLRAGSRVVGSWITAVAVLMIALQFAAQG